MNIENGVAVIIDAAQHVFELNVCERLGDLRYLGGDVFLIRFVFRLLGKINKGLSVINQPFDFNPAVNPLFLLIDFLKDLLCGDVVVPKPGRGRLSLKFGYFLFFCSEVKETPEASQAAQRKFSIEILTLQT